MDRTGDTKTMWDRRNANEVAAARKTFDELKQKGHVAYRVGDDGKATSVMTTFDPDAESVIIRPMAAGG